MDDEDDYTILEVEYAGASRVHRTDFVVLGLNFLTRIARACADSLSETTSVVAMHANWQAEQDHFHEQAAREIETLIAGEEE